MRYLKRWNKKQKNSYKDYLKKFKKQKNAMEKRGEKMADSRPLTQAEYEAVKKDLKEKGRITSINSKIISEQSYHVSKTVSVAYKKELKKRLEAQKKTGMNLTEEDLTSNDIIDEQIKDIEELRIKDIMLGRQSLDVSLINDILKLEHPNWNGYDRQQYISYYVYGSE